MIAIDWPRVLLWWAACFCLGYLVAIVEGLWRRRRGREGRD